MEMERTAGDEAIRGGLPAPGVWAGAAVAAGVSGAYLAAGPGPGSISAGVLLLIVALALAAVTLGGAPYGPEVEGRLDLSARLGLGLLGGALGAAVAAAARWAVRLVGIPSLLAVQLPGQLGAAVGSQLLLGALWGLLLGVVLPWIPGRSAVSRGVAFSLLPSLWVLLKVFPVDLGVGPFGVGLGALAFVFVLLFNALWGLVAGWMLEWGERTDDAPVARPLDA